jgi:hypothetical protein
MSDKVPERLARVETKLDFLINSHLEDKKSQAERCEKHETWTGALTHRVEGLEVTKDKILGAGKLLAVIGSSGGVVGGIVAVIKMLKHGGKIP